MLIAVDLALGVAVIVGILLVTAADRPTGTQGAIAWNLIAVLAMLTAALIAMVATGVRRARRH
jgi:hypothetical protein